MKFFKKFYFEIIRKIIVKLLGDPVISYKINGFDSRMNLSHELPVYKDLYPRYDTLITRVAQFIRKQQKSLSYIDVGANIGDTILRAADESHLNTDHFIAVEPNEKYYPLLTANTKNLKNVTFVKALCESSIAQKSYKAITERGTARFEVAESNTNQNSQAISSTTIDQICKENKFAPDFIKVDTDGFDLEVIKGASQVLKQYKPFLLFEMDPFGDVDYVEKTTKLFSTLVTSVYSTVIVYDNIGNLVLVLKQDQFVNIIPQLINYSKQRKELYYDVLLVPNAGLKFIDSESQSFRNV